MEILKAKLDGKSLRKLESLGNPHLIEFVAEYVQHCNPEKVFVCDDSSEDLTYIRKEAIKNGEERKLATAGHTIHFDHPQDQGRDKKNTRILMPAGKTLGGDINVMERQAGLSEIRGIMKDIMKGKEMLVLFRCLGPNKSVFSIPIVQLTDSYYVAHNEDLLFRPGYDEFKKLGKSDKFFRFIHSLGETKDAVPQNLEGDRKSVV